MYNCSLIQFIKSVISYPDTVKVNNDYYVILKINTQFIFVWGTVITYIVIGYYCMVI